jgi:hypothetical protein
MEEKLQDICTSCGLEGDCLIRVNIFSCLSESTIKHAAMPRAIVGTYVRSDACMSSTYDTVRCYVLLREDLPVAKTL